MPLRVAIVASHPIQHFCPLYAAIAEDPALRLRVLFGSKAGLGEYFDPQFDRTVAWSGGLTAGFDHEFLAGADDAVPSRSIDSGAVAARLAAFDPDAVVGYGFHHRIALRAYLWARLHGRRSLYVSDSVLFTAQRAATRLRRRFTLPLAFRLIDRFLTFGDENERYYRSFGVGLERMRRCPYPFDSRAFDAALGARDRSRAELRRRLGIAEDAVVFLTVGKLTSLKSPVHAVSALAAVLAAAPGSKAVLVLAGDGPLRDEVAAAAARLPTGRVHLPGFVEAGALPAWYLASDVLVHTSSEDRHPVATSEAVYSGLPVISSDRVGSVGPTDDVRPGRNAIVYRYGEVAALAEAMASLAVDRARREAMGAESRRIGRGRGLPQCAAAFRDAVVEVCATGSGGRAAANGLRRRVGASM